jgi:FtsZ-binding cell division protein ZapB
MTENNLQLELSGLERFSHLEDKIFRVVEAVKALRKENETLVAENQKLKSESEALQRSVSGQNQSMAQLQKEREALREKVEKALSLLASLEAR